MILLSNGLMDFDRKNIDRIVEVIRQSRLPNFKQSEGRFQNFTTATMEESSPSPFKEAFYGSNLL